MFNSKIIISDHARERFLERGIKLSNKKNYIDKQIKIDLSPLNISEIIKIKKNEKKIITKQGKVYIIKEIKDKIIVKTIYKINLLDRRLRNKERILN